MEYLALTTLLFAGTIVATRGSWIKLLRIEPKRPLLIGSGLVVLLAARALYMTFSSHRLWLEIATAVGALLCVAFCIANLHWKGMALIALGIALNSLVIGLNHGMPVREIPTHEQVQESFTHRAARSSDRLRLLTDVIWIPAPFATMISIGDVLISVGLCGVAYSASRMPKQDKLIRASHSRTPNGP